VALPDWGELHKNVVTLHPRAEFLQPELNAAVGVSNALDDGTGVFGDLPALTRKWKDFQRKVDRRDRRRAAGRFGRVDYGGLDGGDSDDESASQVAEGEKQLRKKDYLEGRRDCGRPLEEDLAETTEGGYALPFERCGRLPAPCPFPRALDLASLVCVPVHGHRWTNTLRALLVHLRAQVQWH